MEGASTPLSPLEMPFVHWPPISVCWRYDCELDMDQMRASLDTALERFPWVRSELNGTNFVTTKTAKDLLAFRRHTEKVERLEDPAILQALLGAPREGLFQATVVHLPGNVSLLGIVASHALVDACCLLRFVECWSYCFRGAGADSFACERPNLFRPSERMAAWSVAEKIAHGQLLGCFVAPSRDSLVAAVSARKQGISFCCHRRTLRCTRRLRAGALSPPTMPLWRTFGACKWRAAPLLPDASRFGADEPATAWARGHRIWLLHERRTRGVRSRGRPTVAGAARDPHPCRHHCL